MTIFSVSVDKQCQFLYLISYINCYLPVEREYFCSTSCYRSWHLHLHYSSLLKCHYSIHYSIHSSNAISQIVTHHYSNAIFITYHYSAITQRALCWWWPLSTRRPGNAGHVQQYQHLVPHRCAKSGTLNPMFKENVCLEILGGGAGWWQARYSLVWWLCALICVCWSAESTRQKFGRLDREKKLCNQLSKFACVDGLECRK